MKFVKKVILIVLMNLIVMCGIVKADEIIAMTDEQAKEIVSSVMQVFGEDGLTKSNLSLAIEQYRLLSKNYSNEEIARMLEENKSQLEEYNINDEHIDTINKVLRNFDAVQVNKVLDKLDIDEALGELEAGSTIMDLINKSLNNMSTSDKADLVFSILWSATIVHTLIWIIIALVLYKIIVRAIIFHKAGRHAWAVIIPIYKDVTMLKVCGMSPWWLLLLFVPVIGWSILWIVKVASRFMLAEAFDKGAGFGFGLWLLWPIFEGILAISSNCEYVGIEE